MEEAKQGWRFAADAARITDENASSEGRMHTSGGVFVAGGSSLGTAIGKEEGAATSIPGNGGRIAQAWVNVSGGMRVFAVFFWNSEGWTLGNEALVDAVVKQARTTGHQWLIARDASMGPEECKNSFWFTNRHTFIEAPGEGDPKSRMASSPRTCDNVIATHSLQGKIKNMEVVEDFESTPHKSLSWKIQRL